MLKELNMAIKKQQVVSISTEDEEIYIGTPERISVVQGNVKLISDRGLVFIPLDEIKHVMRIISLSC
ncbi:hypothetical protein JI735_19415 [Paenibacillus sonchi]|uniref:Uncharacterized protein n=1 Tax=Paenibacillus sonchi TaxID=373687 RepID=A0A974SAL2_9BACL|nr:hypothetical protein [Paenibacillus sonchi]QQZ58902.1 hypothetical protein JI735_19415 [Paenibacillus sonchi]